MDSEMSGSVWRYLQSAVEGLHYRCQHIQICRLVPLWEIMLIGLRPPAQPLYWGAAPDGRFMLGSDPVDLAACDPTPTAFPSGTANADSAQVPVPGK